MKNTFNNLCYRYSLIADLPGERRVGDLIVGDLIAGDLKGDRNGDFI